MRIDLRRERREGGVRLPSRRRVRLDRQAAVLGRGARPGSLRGQGERRPRRSWQRPRRPVVAEELSVQELLTTAVGHEHLHRRLVLHAVLDAEHPAVEPLVDLRGTVVGPAWGAVVGTDHEQLRRRALRLQLLERLVVAARLDVEDAVDEERGHLVRVAAEPALLPVGVQRGVEQSRTEPGAEQPEHGLGAGQRVAGETLVGLDEREPADGREHGEPGDRVGDAAGDQQVAVQLERARPHDGGLHARQLLVLGVEVGDRAGREPDHGETAVAPGLGACPREGVAHVALRLRPEDVERTTAVTRAADLDGEEVVLLPHAEAGPALAVGRELDDGRSRLQGCCAADRRCERGPGTRAHAHLRGLTLTVRGVRW